MGVAAWLRDLGLERYVSAFRDNDINTEVLPKLTAEDLISIGVTSVGHRRKLLDAIATLSASEPARRAGRIGLGSPTAHRSRTASGSHNRHRPPSGGQTPSSGLPGLDIRPRLAVPWLNSYATASQLRRPRRSRQPYRRGYGASAQAQTCPPGSRIAVRRQSRPFLAPGRRSSSASPSGNSSCNAE